MTFIELNGYGGFKVVLDIGKVSFYGLDPGPKLFVRCDGQEISITENVIEQFDYLDKSIKEFYSPKQIGGIQ